MMVTNVPSGFQFGSTNDWSEPIAAMHIHIKRVSLITDHTITIITITIAIITIIITILTIAIMISC